ncbi:MAG: hypothetical protein K2W97_03075 [Chthoniobacterales bacterium]|nr:hypothetical protein [Chthoniobacterales bacterium]
MEGIQESQNTRSAFRLVEIEMKAKTNRLLILALLFFLVGSTRELVAFPMERKGEEKKASPLGSIAATEEKRRESEVSEEDDEDLDKGDFSGIREENFPRERNHGIQESARTALQEPVNKAREAFKELLDNSSRQEELRPNILNLLKNYEDQRQAWIAEATSQRLAEVESLEEATKEITFSIIEKLDFSTEENAAVFWTGYTLENQRIAMDYAREQGKKTIEMTRDGMLLDQLGMYKRDSPILDADEHGPIEGKSKLGDLLFAAASTKFAQGVHGKVTAIIYKPQTPEQQAAYQRSAYARIEEPILLEREQRGEPVLFVSGNGRVEVPVDIILPALKELLKKIDEIQKEIELLAGEKAILEEMCKRASIDEEITATEIKELKERLINLMIKRKTIIEPQQLLLEKKEALNKRNIKKRDKAEVGLKQADSEIKEIKKWYDGRMQNGSNWERMITGAIGRIISKPKETELEYWDKIVNHSVPQPKLIAENVRHPQKTKYREAVALVYDIEAEIAFDQAKLEWERYPSSENFKNYKTAETKVKDISNATINSIKIYEIIEELEMLEKDGVKGKLINDALQLRTYVNYKEAYENYLQAIEMRAVGDISAFKEYLEKAKQSELLAKH